MKLAEALHERAKLLANMRTEKTRIEEVRALSDEDKDKINKMTEEYNSLDEMCAALRALEVGADDEDDDEDEEDDFPTEDMGKRSKRSKGKNRPVGMFSIEKPNEDERRSKAFASPEYRQCFDHYIRTGRFEPTGEYRDVIVGTASQGGYLITPTQISDNIVQQINNLVFVRQWSKVTKLKTAQSLGVRQITTQPQDSTWTTEIGNIVLDTTMVFGRRDLKPNLLAKGITVSMLEMELSTDIVSVIQDRLAYKQAVAQENAFLNGSGSGQPLGIFTPSASGIPTAQDVVGSTSGAPTVLLSQAFVNAFYSIKQPYLKSANAQWVMNRTIANQVRLMQDLYGRYLWADGGGFNSAPATILGVPVNISEYAPSALTAGAYVACLGNFDYYEIAEVDTVAVKRLEELYAGTNEVGFHARMWVDGSPTLGEAFARVILHA